jgi:hypothetical protein
MAAAIFRILARESTSKAARAKAQRRQEKLFQLFSLRLFCVFAALREIRF